MEIWVAPLAVIVGIVMGALGGGGAILTVPILVYLVGQTPHQATTGSLFIVLFTATAALIPHYRDRNVHVRDGLIFGAVGIVGAIGGSTLSTAVSSSTLMTAFGVLLLIVAALMFRRTIKEYRTTRFSAQQLGAQSAAPTRRGVVTVVVAASLVGLLTGFFGVGGGFAVVPALALTLGYSMRAAVGTSLLVIVVNSVAALATRSVVGLEVDWVVTLTFAVLAVAGSLLGARIAQKTNPLLLSLVFAALLACVATFTLLKPPL